MGFLNGIKKNSWRNLMGNYHQWGDKDFDWDAMEHCLHYFYIGLVKFGRMDVRLKEKYGTLRVDGSLGSRITLSQLIWPGYCYLQYTKSKFYHQIFYIDETIIPAIFKYTGLGKLMFKYQKLVWNVTTLYCVNKYPHITEEITDDFWFDDMLYSWVKKKINYKCNWE